MIESIFKILFAVLIGGLLGAEREFHDKAAGFRTMILICAGAALFTIFSLELGGADDPIRIAASIVTGIGFLGAGVILREGGHVTGLTTAATIWLAAALGIGIGGARFLLVGVAAGILLMVLWVFPHFEGWFHGDRETRTYRVVCAKDFEKLKQLDAFFYQGRLRVKSHEQIIKDDEMICTWEAFGSSRQHALVAQRLHSSSDVRELRLQY
jgi:putative Mg2+ transporter-C (MgtC) family protein